MCNPRPQDPVSSAPASSAPRAAAKRGDDTAWLVRKLYYASRAAGNLTRTMAYRAAGDRVRMEAQRQRALFWIEKIEAGLAAIGCDVPRPHAPAVSKPSPDAGRPSAQEATCASAHAATPVPMPAATSLPAHEVTSPLAHEAGAAAEAAPPPLPICTPAAHARDADCPTGAAVVPGTADGTHITPHAATTAGRVAAVPRTHHLPIIHAAARPRAMSRDDARLRREGWRASRRAPCVQNGVGGGTSTAIHIVTMS